MIKSTPTLVDKKMADSNDDEEKTPLLRDRYQTTAATPDNEASTADKRESLPCNLWPHSYFKFAVFLAILLSLMSGLKRHTFLVTIPAVFLAIVVS